MTEYIILRQLQEEVAAEGGPPAWREHGRANASSPERALRSLGDGVVDGTYVAIPKRSWKPLPVQLGTKTVVTIG